MNEWMEMKELEYWNNIEYRIKQQSEAKFRPFNTEEVAYEEKDFRLSQVIRFARFDFHYRRNRF